MSRKTFQKFRRSGVAGTREFSGMAEPYHMVETVNAPLLLFVVHDRFRRRTQVRGGHQDGIGVFTT